MVRSVLATSIKGLKKVPPSETAYFKCFAKFAISKIMIFLIAKSAQHRSF